MLGICIACMLAVPAAAPARGRVPSTFVGMNVDQGTIASASMGRELRLMAATGVGVVRFPLFWSVAQPVEDGPIDYTTSDRIVGAAARAGLRLLPCVVGAPTWDRQYPDRPFSPPARPEPYAAFLSALASRYGPAGSFWAAHPRIRRRPIRNWQIWNEPNGGYTWADDQRELPPKDRTHWVRPYLSLLQAAHDAIKRIDARSRIVLGGLVGESWTSLRGLYAADPSAGRLFDVVALHPYTRKPTNVQYTIQLDRWVLHAYRDDAKPVVLTEFGWPSSVGHIPSQLGFETSEAGQATRLASGLKMLARSRRHFRTEAVYWYDWAEPDSGPSVFGFSGLWRRVPNDRLVAKPAFRAFRRTVRQLKGR
jgi:hypothetical protein